MNDLTDQNQNTSSSGPSLGSWLILSAIIFGTLTVAGFSLYLPFLWYDLKFEKIEDYYSYTEFVSSIATALAILWILVNSVMQQRQIDMQRQELSLNNKTLAKTSTATFSQFYIMYFDEFERSLDRIASRILTVLGIDTTSAVARRRAGERDAHINTLASIDGLIPLLSTHLSDDNGDVVREYVEQYISVYAQLLLVSKLRTEPNDEMNMLSVFEASNPATQLRRSLAYALERHAATAGDEDVETIDEG